MSVLSFEAEIIAEYGSELLAEYGASAMYTAANPGVYSDEMMKQCLDILDECLDFFNGVC